MENESGIYELPVGISLNGGKYIIRRKIGSGGFGITYEAEQVNLGLRVCIKEYFLSGKCIRNTRNKTIVSVGIAPDIFEKYRQAFEKEARILASLHHTSIVEVIDIFNENGTSYMVMPFLEGISLQAQVEKGGRLPYEAAYNYIVQICSAVNYLHMQNILHRDIKPDNIMLTADYKAVLIDFGSAREFVTDKTQLQTVMVTHGYAPTEQYTVNSRKGAYTDIYALGATLYFALTGQTPISATARVTEELPEPISLFPNIPEEANRTIMKAMQIRPENRHQSVEEFIDDLSDVKPSSPIKEPIRKTSKKWIIVTIVSVLISIVAVIALIKVPQRHKVKTYDFVPCGLYPVVKVGTMESGKPIYMGVYEVSQDFWSAVMGERHSSYYSVSDDFEDADAGRFPVINVSWAEVRDFIHTLNEQTEKVFDIPYVQVWQYAAKGGAKASSDVHYATITETVAGVWYRRNNPCPVDYKGPYFNRLGLRHMCGNAAEFCKRNEGGKIALFLCGGAYDAYDDQDIMIENEEIVEGSDIRYPNAGFRLVCY